MLAYISGIIKYKTDKSAIIVVAGLGYEVFVAAKILAKYQAGEAVELFLYQHIREDSSSLFGFVDQQSVDLFKKLISVSGIGPKSAMNILENISANDFINSIYTNNPDLLTGVSGIGKKTAERVILELKNKIDSLIMSGIKNESFSGGSNDEIDALIALGYSAGQAREALNNVSLEIVDISNRIKEALKYLSGKKF